MSREKRSIEAVLGSGDGGKGHSSGHQACESDSTAAAALDSCTRGLRVKKQARFVVSNQDAQTSVDGDGVSRRLPKDHVANNDQHDQSNAEQKGKDVGTETGHSKSSGERKIAGTCSECGKNFKTLEGLNQHMMSHTGEKPLECPECRKAFRQQSALRNHLLIHAGIKAHVCEYCSKAFTERSQLKVHLLTHTGDRPFKCSTCGKGFTTAANCREHQLTHTDEKPHQCGECGRAFRHRSVLQKHMLTHTGERPWVCKVCDRGFQKACNLQRHERTHKGETAAS